MSIKSNILDAVSGDVIDGFTLHLETDNAAMEYPEDVAETLRAVAAQVEDHGYGSASVRDANGNTIGAWSLNDVAGGSLSR